MKDVVLKEIIL